jgi:hypothetical protein
METPIRFITNFKSSDGIDLGDKFITKDYILSVYPHLSPYLVESGLFWQGARKYASSSYVRPSLTQIELPSIEWKQISNSKLIGGPGGSSSVFHSMALKSDGTLWAWGDNNRGQLGVGNNTSIYGLTNDNIASIVGNTNGTFSNWKCVSCGSEHTLAIKNDGSLWGWGRNSEYQLGQNNTTNKNAPIQITSSYDWKSVSASNLVSLAIKNDGTLWSWGTNYNYLLGMNSNSTSAQRKIPTQVGTDTDWKMIDINSISAYGLKTDGSLWFWGDNDGYVMGSSTSSYYEPTKFVSSIKWKFVSVGVRHVAAISQDGKLYSRGYNGYGALGTNNYDSQSSFTLVNNGGYWKYISCGYDFTVGIMVDGSLWAWGNNNDKQVSTSSLNGISAPVIQSSSYNWKQISAHPFAYGAIRTYNYI